MIETKQAVENLKIPSRCRIDSIYVGPNDPAISPATTLRRADG